jgi:hypothetical protein
MVDRTAFDCDVEVPAALGRPGAEFDGGEATGVTVHSHQQWGGGSVFIHVLNISRALVLGRAAPTATAGTKVPAARSIGRTTLVGAFAAVPGRVGPLRQPRNGRNLDGWVL